MSKKIAFLFPGQGAQYVGMGRDFYDAYPAAKAIFDEADAILGRPLSKIIFDGPEEALTETKNSQVGIYVTSMAILKVIQERHPELKPAICAGFSLGEYTAITASGRLSFEECLPLVQARGQFMNEACESTSGAMAAVLGLTGEQIEEICRGIDGLWAANFNCPGQVVISGSQAGVAAGIEAAKELGARRALPLKVHGAFHSGLMTEAEERLKEKITTISLKQSPVQLVMNVTGGTVADLPRVGDLMARQVTSSVRWEQTIATTEGAGVDLYIEIGCGRTLSGLNKRIGVEAPTINVDKVDDLEKLGEIA